MASAGLCPESASIGLVYLGGPLITAAMLSLALNLVLTGAVILVVKWLVAGDRPAAHTDLVPRTHSRHQI